MRHGWLVVLVLVLPCAASAGEEGIGDWTVGVSGASAIFDTGEYGVVGGMEITATIQVLGVQVWFTNGYRFRFVETFDGYLFYEFGFWALLNLGAGVTIGGGDQQPVHFTLFAGLPIPIFGITDSDVYPGVFIEPYYRPMLGWRRPGERGGFFPDLTAPTPNTTEYQEEWTHEVGVMLKFTSATFTWPWEDDPDEP